MHVNLLPAHDCAARVRLDHETWETRCAECGAELRPEVITITNGARVTAALDGVTYAVTGASEGLVLTRERETPKPSALLVRSAGTLPRVNVGRLVRPSGAREGE